MNYDYNLCIQFDIQIYNIYIYVCEYICVEEYMGRIKYICIRHFMLHCNVNLTITVINTIFIRENLAGQFGIMNINSGLIVVMPNLILNLL